MPPSSGSSQREREILEEEIAVPLRRLRRSAGDPTYGKIAADSRLCRNTVDNAFNARRLVRYESVDAIVTALGGDTAQWRHRWVTARDRIDALRDPGPAQTAPAEEPLPAAAPEPASPRRAPKLVRRRLVAAAATVVAVFGWVIAGTVLAFGSVHREDLGDAGDQVAATPTPPRDQVMPMAGNPVYFQCSDRGRSILSKPGRVRGGLPRGTLKPGERIVVTSKTAYWRFGHVSDDPGRQGWVLAQFLCRVTE